MKKSLTLLLCFTTILSKAQSSFTSDVHRVLLIVSIAIIIILFNTLYDIYSKKEYNPFNFLLRVIVISVLFFISLFFI